MMLNGDYFAGLPNPGPFVDFSPLARGPETASQTRHQEALIYEGTIPGHEGWDWSSPYWWARRSGAFDLPAENTELATYYGDSPAALALNILAGQGQLWT